jgi:hypothetical protein
MTLLSNLDGEIPGTDRHAGIVPAWHLEQSTTRLRPVAAKPTTVSDTLRASWVDPGIQVVRAQQGGRIGRRGYRSPGRLRSSSCASAAQRFRAALADAMVRPSSRISPSIASRRRCSLHPGTSTPPDPSVGSGAGAWRGSIQSSSCRWSGRIGGIKDTIQGWQIEAAMGCANRKHPMLGPYRWLTCAAPSGAVPLTEPSPLYFVARRNENRAPAHD